MRQRTIVVLLALILLFAFFGLAFLKYVFAAVLTLIILFFVALFVGAWLLKRRMRRKLAELQQAFIQGQKEAVARRKADETRSNAIDAEFEADSHDRR